MWEQGGRMSNKKFRKKLAILSLVACNALGLSACAPALNFKLATIAVSAAANDFFKRTDVNLLEKNNAAADYMSVPMKEFIDRTDVMIAEPLSQSDNKSITSPLGMKIAEDMSRRFSQLGFNVNMHQVVSDAQRERMHPAKTEGKFVFSGHYLRNNKSVNISLYVMNVQSSQIIASFDYTLPVTREIETLSNTLPRIFKVEPEY